MVNTRGMGMSDRPRGLTIEARMDDVRAVMDAVGSERATMLGWAETSNTCVVFGATYPERVERLILYAAVCARHALGRLSLGADARGGARATSLSIGSAGASGDYLEEFAQAS